MIRNAICLGLFFVLFALGLFVDSNSIDRTAIYGWPLYVMTKTVTNLGLICFACSCIGDGSYADCAVRGLVIYLIALIGTVGGFPEAMLVNTSPEQYGTVAGVLGYFSARTAIENPPVKEWIKGFGIGKRKEQPTHE